MVARNDALAGRRTRAARSAAGGGRRAVTLSGSLECRVEEEYLLVDRETRDLVAKPDPALWDGLRDVLGPQVGPEFLKAQIEVGTVKSNTLQEAHQDLARLRRELSNVVTESGAAIIAASTHPFAQWWDQQHTEDARYDKLAADFQQVARRLVICGMHVHVGIDDNEPVAIGKGYKGELAPVR